MKTIKGFENEDIQVSDFGEWVGQNYVDYKFEYENNNKIIKSLYKENQQQKEVIQTYETLLKTNIEENKQLKEQLEASEKARKGALDLIEKLRFEKWSITGRDIVDVMDILDIDKGE